MNISRWLSAIFIIAITIIGLGFTKYQQIQAAMAMAASFPEPSAAVNSVKTTLVEFQDSKQVTGQITATQVVNLQNELAGIISKVNFQAGDSVTKGQLLLALNSAEEQAQLAAANANLILAKQNFTRIKKLLAQNKVSQQEFDNAQAQLMVTKANSQNLKAIIAKKHIIAPFNGTVGLATYQVGQFLAANTKLTTLVGNAQQMWVDFQLPQTSSKLAIGDQVQVKAIGQDNSQYQLATIIAKNSEIKDQSRHLQYRALLPQARAIYEHNEIVSVKVLSPQQQVILVPNSAISRNQHGNFLFALEQDESNNYRAKRIAVQLGKRVHDQQIITSGIAPDTLIATEGAFKLREGLLVYPQQTSTTAFIALQDNKD